MATYRSGFEEAVGAVLCPAGFTYESTTVDYTIPGTYTPDFVLTLDGYYQILVECKGWFRAGDQKKYKHINNAIAMEGSQELVFMLQYPSKRTSKGAKQTMAEWCEKQGIRWFASPEQVIEYAHTR
jgi:hypothetical protein